MHYIALLAMASAALSQSVAAATSKTFVECPIIRDTEQVPCWLVEHGGETYYLGIQTDTLGTFHPPTLGQRALIEGVVSDEPRICGGVVLKDVHSGPIGNPGECPRIILPSEASYQLPFKAPRPPGPNPAKKFSAPQNAADFLRPRKFEPPYGSRRFEISFEFDGASFWFDDQRILLEIIGYAKDSKARRINVVGQRTQIRLDDGTILTEFPALAEIRATMTANQIKSGQLPSLVETSWREVPVIGGASQRLVTVEVIP